MNPSYQQKAAYGLSGMGGHAKTSVPPQRNTLALHRGKFKQWHIPVHRSSALELVVYQHHCCCWLLLLLRRRRRRRLLNAPATFCTSMFVFDNVLCNFCFMWLLCLWQCFPSSFVYARLPRAGRPIAQLGLCAGGAGLHPRSLGCAGGLRW